ncbi:Uncharacterised protein [uncultured archaeon]|nr:Uncharacterised protein [uncultured archaeon]
MKKLFEFKNNEGTTIKHGDNISLIVWIGFRTFPVIKKFDYCEDCGRGNISVFFVGAANMSFSSTWKQLKDSRIASEWQVDLMNALIKKMSRKKKKDEEEFKRIWAGKL